MAKVLSMEVFKKRPVLTASLVVVGGLLVYFLFFRGGSSNTSPSAVGYGDANVNAASGLAAAQMQTQARGQEIQGQLSALQIQGANELAVTQAQAGLQRDIAAMSLESARLDHARDMYGLEVQERIESLGIQTSAQIEQLRVSSELEALKVQADRDLMQQKIMTEGQLALSAQAAQVTLAGIHSQENLAHYSMDTTLGLQKMAYDTQLALGAQDIERTKITVGGQNYAASKSASASKSGSKWGAIASVAGVALSLFCDRHIKSIDGCVDSARCLDAVVRMPVEFWHYLEGSEPHEMGDTAQHLNTYAQDFYRELGSADWMERKHIDTVDYLGALSGAVKELARSRANG